MCSSWAVKKGKIVEVCSFRVSSSPFPLDYAIRQKQYLEGSVLMMLDWRQEKHEVRLKRRVRIHNKNCSVRGDCLLHFINSHNPQYIVMIHPQLQSCEETVLPNDTVLRCISRSTIKRRTLRFWAFSFQIDWCGIPKESKESFVCLHCIRTCSAYACMNACASEMCTGGRRWDICVELMYRTEFKSETPLLPWRLRYGGTGQTTPDCEMTLMFPSMQSGSSRRRKNNIRVKYLGSWKKDGDRKTERKKEHQDKKTTKPKSLESESQSEKLLVDVPEAKLSFLTSIKHKHE